MSTIIKLRCIDQVLTFESTPVIASGGLEEDVLSVEFCSKWDGLAKTAVFWRSEEDAYHVLLDDSGSCHIPREVLTDEGVFYFGIFGVGGGRQRTTEAMRYTVVQGAITSGTKPSDPTPAIYTQLLAQYKEVKDLASRSATAAEASRVAAERAAAGAAPSGFGLGTGATNISDTDLLETLAKGQTGWYKGVNVLNSPDPDRWCYFHIISEGYSYAVVLAYPFAGGEHRALYEDGILRPWVQSSVSTHTHTAGDVGAVSKAGDTMTGDLTIEKGLAALNLKSTKSDRKTTLNAGEDGFLALYNRLDSENFQGIYLPPETATLANALRLVRKVAGVLTQYPIYHTGNPPTAAEVKARPDNWLPTAAEVKARPDNWLPTAAEVGGLPVVDARAASFNMTDILLGGRHAAIYLTDGRTEGTPHKLAGSGFTDALIISYASWQSPKQGFQIAIANGGKRIYVRRGTAGAAEPWGKLFSSIDQPTMAELGIVSSTTDIAAGSSANWQQYLVYV